MGLRPIDLAREAGISAQQVRNYTDAGLLPPVSRTASGYRVYGERHRAALLVYRALARGFGWASAEQVIRAANDGDVPSALATVDAGHAELHERRLALRATAAALESLADDPDDMVVPKERMRIGEVARHLGIRTSALRVWEQAGLLTPERQHGTGYRVYRRADVRDARLVQMLRQGHHLFRHIQPILDELHASGGTEALRAAIAQRERAHTAQATAMLEASARLHAYLRVGSVSADADDQSQS